MSDEIYAERSCISEGMKWEMTGALNTAEMIASKNLNELKEELRGIPSESIPGFEKMALKKLEDDLDAISKVKKELDKIDICR